MRPSIKTIMQTREDKYKQARNEKDNENHRPWQIIKPKQTINLKNCPVKGKQLETLMIQIMKGNSIAYLREFFTFCSNQTYQLRSKNHVLRLTKPNTNALMQSFAHKGAAAWNNTEEHRKF